MDEILLGPVEILWDLMWREKQQQSSGLKGPAGLGKF